MISVKRPILFIACNPVMGGSEYLWMGSARCLKAAGRRVAASVPESMAKLDRTAALNGCADELQIRPMARPLKWFERGWRADAEVEALAGLLRREQPSLVVISQSYNKDGRWWAELCQSREIPYCLISQQAGEATWPRDEDLEATIRAYSGARASYFVSHGNLRLTERQLGMAIPRNAVVRNPFHVPYRPELDWPDSVGGWNIAIVARLDAFDKGIDIVIRLAASETWRSRPVTFRLYGEGKHSDALRAWKNWRGVDNLVFEGWTPNVTDVWANNHLVLLPSRQEGLPIALVEAMLCGRAAVVSDVGGNAEVVEDGKTGFLAEAPVYGCVEAAMERAWNSRLSWREMGAAAGDAVRSKVPEDPCAIFAAELTRLADLAVGP